MWIYSKESINAEPQSQKNAEKNLKAYTERALKNGKIGFFVNRSEFSFFTIFPCPSFHVYRLFLRKLRDFALSFFEVKQCVP
jgi:hypothetical protein